MADLPGFNLTISILVNPDHCELGLYIRQQDVAGLRGLLPYDERVLFVCAVLQ